MGESNTVLGGSYIAGAAIELGDCLKLDTTNNYPYVIKTAANTDICIAIATADAAAGEAVQCIKLGVVTTVRVSGAVSEGDNLTPEADGEVKTAASGDQVMGQAMEAASNADDEIRAFVYPGWLLA